MVKQKVGSQYVDIDEEGEGFLTKRVTACKWKVMLFQVVGPCVVFHGKFNLYRLK